MYIASMNVQCYCAPFHPREYKQRVYCLRARLLPQIPPSHITDNLCVPLAKPQIT